MYLSDYKVKKIIGRGSQGNIFSSERKRDGREVVIKEVFKNTSSTNMIPNEVKLLQKVQNIEGVIKMLDFINEKDCYYIVMEKINECEDLFQFLNNSGPLTEKFIRKMFHNIVKTVMKCRERGVFHRDLKDENILVDLNTFEIKLIDFGVGCEYDYKEPEKMIKEYRATPEICPPEWILEKEYKLEKLTVWNLGTLLFTMLCGDIPFTTEDEICSGKLIYTKTLSNELQDLIEQCLKIKQEDRISLDNILSHKWMMM